MPDKEEDLEDLMLQASHLPNGREIDESDTAYFDRRLSRADCALPDWDIPDAAYRPVPIVWFFSAWLVQFFALIVCFKIGSSLHYYLAIAFCVLITGLIAKWTWRRGMTDAGKGWKIATIMMLTFQLAFAVLLGLAMVESASA
jgi:hypothetical protein